MKHKDVAFGLMFFSMGILLLILIPVGIQSTGSEAVGPRGFPYFLTVLLLVLSATLIGQGVNKQRKKAQEKSVEINPSNHEKNEEMSNDVRLALVFFVLIGAYVLVMKWIGFILSSLLFLPVMLYTLQVRKKIFYIVLIPIIGVIYYIFKVLLYVQLP